jgi:hypothetical protein
MPLSETGNRLEETAYVQREGEGKIPYSVPGEGRGQPGKVSPMPVEKACKMIESTNWLIGARNDWWGKRVLLLPAS